MGRKSDLEAACGPELACPPASHADADDRAGTAAADDALPDEPATADEAANPADAPDGDAEKHS